MLRIGNAERRYAFYHASPKKLTAAHSLLSASSLFLLSSASLLGNLTHGQFCFKFVLHTSGGAVQKTTRALSLSIFKYPALGKSPPFFHPSVLPFPHARAFGSHHTKDHKHAAPPSSRFSSPDACPMSSVPPPLSSTACSAAAAAAPAPAPAAFTPNHYAYQCVLLVSVARRSRPIVLLGASNDFYLCAATRRRAAAAAAHFLRAAKREHKTAPTRRVARFINTMST